MGLGEALRKPVQIPPIDRCEEEGAFEGAAESRGGVAASMVKADRSDDAKAIKEDFKGKFGGENRGAAPDPGVFVKRASTILVELERRRAEHHRSL